MNALHSFRYVLLASVLLALASCARDGADEWIRAMETSHERAEVELAAGDRGAARRTLETAVNLSVPASIRAEDARRVRQDLYYRLAMTELSAGQAKLAVAWATAGLSLGTETDVFTANLYIARAKAEEALGRPALASSDYHAALRISEQLLDIALGKEAR